MFDIILGILVMGATAILLSGAFLMVRDKERAWHLKYDKKQEHASNDEK